MDSMHTRSQYTQPETEQYYTMLSMASRIKSGSSAHADSRNSGGRIGHTEQHPSGRFQDRRGHNNEPPAPAAMGLTPRNMSDNSTILGAKTAAQ